MKTRKIFTLILAVFTSIALKSQDVKSISTMVSDLLAAMPAKDSVQSGQQMRNMLHIGEDGIRMICDRVIPAGTGDDIQPRFAIANFSRFLSAEGHQADRPSWEKICISYISKNSDAGVKDFFMKQLQLVGSDESIEAVKALLKDKTLCEPALAVITATGGRKAETVLVEALSDNNLPCAAGVMNTLASMGSSKAINEFINWSQSQDADTRNSAFNAMAMSGSPLAFTVLSDASQKASYKWEPSGAVDAFAKYAGVLGKNGDLKMMDRICKLLFSKCNDRQSIQYKISALDFYARYHGTKAIPELIRAMKDPDASYRAAALRFSEEIDDPSVMQRWISYFKNAPAQAKPEIINMMGVKGDKRALPLVNSALSNPDIKVRNEAAAAIVKLEGMESMNSLVNYLLQFSSDKDQEAAVSALMSITNDGNIKFLLPVLKDGNHAAKKSAIRLFAWKKNQDYYDEVLPYTSSEDETVKSAAFDALPDLSAPEDINGLVALLRESDLASYISDLRAAIISADLQIHNDEKRSDIILDALKSADIKLKLKLIPVLAKTGGRDALSFVLKEFENGNPDLRDTCFNALSSWRDFTASSALFEICASGDKKYEEPAFEAYLRQVGEASIPDEEKLLLYRKIMPFAKSDRRKIEIINCIGRLRTYQSLFFTGQYLDDPATSGAAALAAMNIALPSADSKAGLAGTLVRDILRKAMDRMTGSESDYNREMINKYLAEMPADEGFRPMFNGQDLSGWQGLVEDPIARSKMTPQELAKKQAEANKKIAGNWSVKNSCIWFNGNGNNLCSVKEYGDFEMLVDWKISRKGDSGIYLRGSPQVQIWDTSRTEVGAQVGSGGLYNNKKNPAKPLKVADNPVGDWNTFRIVMVGEKVSVWLNGELVVDNVTLENYWNYDLPIFPKGPIELQAHGTDLGFRDIYVREINNGEKRTL